MDSAEERLEEKLYTKKIIAVCGMIGLMVICTMLAFMDMSVKGVKLATIEACMEISKTPNDFSICMINK